MPAGAYAAVPIPLRHVRNSLQVSLETLSESMMLGQRGGGRE